MSNEQKPMLDFNEAFSAWQEAHLKKLKTGEEALRAGDFDVPMLDVLHESTYVALSVCGHLV